MRIAFVNDTFLEGRGADHVIYELAKRLGKRHDVFVISTIADFPEENFKILKINAKKLLTGNTIRDSISYFPNILKFRREILKLQKKYGFDVFNVFHSSLNIAFVGFPAIVTWLGSPRTNNYFRRIINRTMLRTLKNGRIVVISKYLRNQLNSLKKVKIIPCGISQEFRPLKKANDKKYILYIGRLEKHKSIHELIRLSKELSFPLKIAGYGPLEDRLRAYSKRIGANKVVFLGKVSRKDLIKNYQKCSFFVSASKWEGFGLIFLEAASCAKPSIGYKVGAIPEVVIDGETGFLVNDFLELKKKAGELIKDKKLRKVMGKQALRFSREFSWNKSAKKYERAFMEIKNG